MRRRNLSIRVILIAFVVLTLAAIQGGSRSAEPEENGAVKSLKISLFPYVPDQKLITKAIEERWKKLHPDIELQFVDGKKFDSYKQDPPDDLDVFEFDSIMLDYYVRSNLISPIALAEVKDAEDYLTFAWKGCMVDGRLYAIPRLACTYVLIYRQGDDAIEKVVGLRDLYAVLGKGSEVKVPEKNMGLLIDLTGGTDCACLYLDAVSDTTGRYSLHPKLPPATDLDNEGLNDIRLLARMAGKTQATLSEPENGPPQRPAWFGDGRGRAFVGYSERLYFIPKSAHDKLRVRALPMDDENKVNLFFVDMLAINSSLRGDRRRLALELINVCTAKDTMLECLTPQDDDKPSQYLLPVRASVFQDVTLLKKAPLYKDLGAIIDAKTSPRAFRIGPEVRDWLNANKSLIRGRLFE